MGNEKLRLVTSKGLVFIAMVIANTIVSWVEPAQAQTFSVIHNFSGGQDGGYPGALTVDGAGNVVGTTNVGGAHGHGLVFRLSRRGSNWILTPLYSFQGGSDGVPSGSKLIFGPNGTIYGTTWNGGHGFGTVFNLRPPPRACSSTICPWTETVLYQFSGGSDGDYPGDLTFDHAGNLYGTTKFGGLRNCNGQGCGVVYELTPLQGGWTETVLYSFAGGNDGGFPGGGVTFDQGGNLYGVAGYGSSYQGIAYELTPSGSGWVENTIYTLTLSEGGYEPLGPPIFDQAGNLDFVTQNDTMSDGSYVYQLVKSGNNWTLMGLGGLAYQFISGSLSMDTAGNLYDTAVGEARWDTYGSVFTVPQTGGQTILHSFTSDCSDGCDPSGGVALDAQGNLYGTTTGGGAYAYGVVFEIAP